MAGQESVPAHQWLLLAPVPKVPKKNLEYWVPKFERNVERDQRNLALLQEQGWRVHVIWECELKKKTIDATFESLIPALREELDK